MSDALSEIHRGTYFKDRSQLPFGYDERKEEPIKQNWWKKLINKLKRK